MNLALPREELTAGLLAAAVHGLFALLLVVGVSWQIHDPRPVMADIWTSLPAPPRDQAEAAPKPKPVAPEPAPPQAKPAPAPDDKAAEIALEKKKREQEERLKRLKAEEAEKQRRAEEARKQAEQEADRKRREELLRQELEDMARRAAADEAGQRQASREAAQRATEVDRLVAGYKDRISAKIRDNTRLPDNLQGNPQVEFRLTVLPSGEIAKITLSKSSGNPAFDQAVLRGIEKSSPLPLPPDKAAAERFRDLDIKHRARE